MNDELFNADAEDERGPHRRCTGHVTGSSADLVTCPLRATRVVGEHGFDYYACDNPGHLGNSTYAKPIAEFFEHVRVTVLAREAEAMLDACIEPE